MIRAIKCRLLLVALLLGAADVRAVEAGHSPFEPGKGLKPFPLVEIPASSQPKNMDAPQLYEFTDRAEKGKTRVVKIFWPTDGGAASVTLSVNGAKVFSGKIEGSPLSTATIYRADLNGDGVPDYVAMTWSGGCGLAGEMSWVTFLLSSPAGYTRTEVLSFDAEPADVVDIGGRAYLVDASFVYGEAGRDGRAHNYWVYNLLRVDGKTLALDNAADHRFPKWVLYTFAPNHHDTDQLTPEQRERLWRQYLKDNPWSLGGG